MRARLAGVVGLLTALALVLPAAPALAADTTTITFQVTGCERCVIQGTTVTNPTGPVYSGPKARVRGGRAVMTVPTAQTVGMTFFLTPPWQLRIDALPLIAFQYQGIAPGTRVTKAQVRAARAARACWSGTTQAAVDLRVTVRTVMVPAFDPENENPGLTKAPLAWVQPTQQALPPYEQLWKGVLAAQDNTLCRVT